MHTTGKRVLLLALACVCTACAENGTTGQADAPVATATTQDQTPSCRDETTIAYVCGPVNAEDILRIGNSEWLLVSGMNGELANNPAINGRIHLVNHQTREWQVLFPGTGPVMAHDTAMFGNCPGPLDASNFSAHGLALQPLDGAEGQYRVYMTSHGAREAIEVFEIDMRAQPSIQWVGCVPMPSTSWTNSLVVLNDGGFLATQFMDPTGSGMAGVIAQEITGHVFEWHPDGDVGVVTGTELSGPNGIALSEDERWIYVAAFGTHEVVRFDRSASPPTRDSVAITIAPDNIRWSTDGHLLTAGGNITDGCGGPDCGTGWSVIEVVPDTMTASRLAGVDESVAMQGVSSALRVDDELWIGTYSGDRLGILPLP